LSEQQHRAAIWVKNDVNDTTVDIVAHTPLPFLFSAITNRPPRAQIPVWPSGNVIDYDAWRYDIFMCDSEKSYDFARQGIMAR
jgi:hypothetical protein